MNYKELHPLAILPSSLQSPFHLSTLSPTSRDCAPLLPTIADRPTLSSRSRLALDRYRIASPSFYLRAPPHTRPLQCRTEASTEAGLPSLNTPGLRVAASPQLERSWYRFRARRGPRCAEPAGPLPRVAHHRLTTA